MYFSGIRSIWDLRWNEYKNTGYLNRAHKHPYYNIYPVNLNMKVAECYMKITVKASLTEYSFEDLMLKGFI